MMNHGIVWAFSNKQPPRYVCNLHVDQETSRKSSSPQFIVDFFKNMVPNSNGIFLLDDDHCPQSNCHFGV